MVPLQQTRSIPLQDLRSALVQLTLLILDQNNGLKRSQYVQNNTSNVSYSNLSVGLRL